MIKLKHLPFIALTICLISCRQVNSDGPRVILITEANLTDIPLERVLAQSEFVPLEFTPESALSESAIFLDNTSGFFLIDQFKEKKIYQFAKDGRFIRTIGQPGKGPGEYTTLSDALITENGLVILAGSPQTRIHWYDLNGQYVRTDLIMDPSSYSFGIHPVSRNYLFCCDVGQNIIREIDCKSLQPVDSFIKRNTNLITAATRAISSTQKATILFYQPFDNRIFELQKDTFRLRYTIENGNTAPAYNDLDREAQMKILKEGELLYIYKATENDKWLYLLVIKEVAKKVDQSRSYSLLFNKVTGALYRLPSGNSLAPLFYPAFGLGEDDVLYTAIQPVSVMDSDEWKGEFKKRGLPLNPDGNFIIVKINLKNLLGV